MKTKDQNLILEQMLNYLKKEKRGMLMVDSLIFLTIAIVLSLVWTIMTPVALVTAIIVMVIYAIFYWKNIRKIFFRLPEKTKTLQLLELAVRKTKTKISSSNSEQKISKYLVNLLTERDRGEVWHLSFILKELLFEIEEKTKKENEWNLLYESPSIDSLMIRFFEEIAMISQNKREEYLEEIKKLYKFFSKKI